MQSRKKLLLLLTTLLAGVTLTASATVYFQNTGTISGWDSADPQQQGRILQVSSPTWNGGTALAFEQTFNGSLTGYHSEVIKTTTQANGQERYYGKVIRLPSNWVFHDKNDTYMQFSPENPSGPWRLVWIQNHDLWTQTLSGNKKVGTINANTWVRTIFRLKLDSSTGAYEVWINGTRTLSQVNINQTVPGSTIRWSNGIYCTSWRTTAPPAGDATQRTIYQDQFRIASSPAEADPIHW